MNHVFKYILSDYIDDNDKKTLLQGKTIEDFTLPFDTLGVSVHYDNDYALRWASLNGHLEIVKFLIEKGANIHSQDDIALRNASYKGHLSVVKLLVEKGADIHAIDDLALISASYHGHLSVVEFLKNYVKN